jgi:GT2 family glycosyltransferase
MADVTLPADDLIICTRNRPHDVARCLDSVAAQTHVPVCTTIVDSSDDDATKHVVEAYARNWPAGHALDYLHSEPGLVHQRAVGFAATNNPVVHYIDDDTVLERGYIEGILTAFANDARDEIGGVGGFITNQPEHRLRRIDEVLQLDSRREGVVLPSGRNVRVYTEPAHDIDVDWVPGCAMSYRRHVLDAVPFDERVGRDRNGEDVQLSYRVRQRWRLVITPKARLAHLESAVERRSIEKLTTVELISRWERVNARTGNLKPSAFWLSAFGQLGWYSLKAATTLSRERWAIARATARAMREIRSTARASRGS